SRPPQKTKFSEPNVFAISNDFFTFAAAYAKTSAFEEVAAPCTKRWCVKLFVVFQSNFLPVSFILFLIKLTISSKLSFDSFNVLPSGAISTSWKQKYSTPVVSINSKIASTRAFDLPISSKSSQSLVAVPTPKGSDKSAVNVCQ